MQVSFKYVTGVKGQKFSNPVLWGSWKEDGTPSENWSVVPMDCHTGEDGTIHFDKTVMFPDSVNGQKFRWGVRADGPSGSAWMIVNEVNDSNSSECTREFELKEDKQEEVYYLSYARRLGANKVFTNGSAAPMAGFGVWAPNAVEVQLVFGDTNTMTGYISDDGTGIAGDPIPMTRQQDGVWWVDGRTAKALKSFADVDHKPYMYRIRKQDAPEGQWSYRTDLYSRCQIGHGKNRPGPDGHYRGSWKDLDGLVSCSVAVDAENVTKNFSEPDWPETKWVTVEEFWKDEFNPKKPLPKSAEELVIYEMHIGGLGFGMKDQNGNPIPGTLKEAIELLDYLSELGINAVELLPMAEFEGYAAWGYATSHYQAVEFNGGGRDQMKFFIKECHKRGIAVIMDVVYNHFAHHGDRAEWAYDSDRPENNIYYWYEGMPNDYPAYEAAARDTSSKNPPAAGHGGYVDNMSTAYAPRYWDENVRKLFISSALMLITEFHVDGFRADQTTSIHAYNVLHADGRVVGSANVFGAKFLRDWCRAVRLVKPNTFLLAEDHSGWDAVTEPIASGGIGFDAAWYADFYHHLSGDTDKSPTEYAKLLTSAAKQDFGPMNLSFFSGALAHTSRRTVVYNESHDEAGNSTDSGRTLTIAVGRAPLLGETRIVAEARSRFAAGITLLSAGIPMFFMGEEVGFQEDYRYNDFLYHKEDFKGLRKAEGAKLFRYYQDLISLRRKNPEFTHGFIDVFHINNAGRVIAFLRGKDEKMSFVVASLSNAPYQSYDLFHDLFATGSWREVFNSDAGTYNGLGYGNQGALLYPSGNRLTVRIPANGLVVFKRQ